MKQKSLFLTIAVLLGLRIAATAQTPPSYVPAEGLVGWWPFNGNANDESGNGNNGTVNGATLTEDRDNIQNQAFNFDGIDDFIQINSLNNSPYNPVTYGLWFYANELVTVQLPLGTQVALIGRDQAGVINQGNIGIWHNPNANVFQKFQYYTGGSGQIFNFSPLTGQWYHIAFVFSEDQTMELYVNGNLAETVNFSSTNLNANIQFRIGAGTNFDGVSPRFNWNGVIDDIGIWNRALSSNEIAGLFNSVECTNDLAISPENTTANLGSTISYYANTTDVNPQFNWQTDLGQGFQNVVDYGNYSGASSSTLTISDLQLMNHNQPIRVISTSGVCLDTSAVALISIADTCITQVIDTTYITVTDTLIINLGPTGFNPITYSNTILMYPNPSSNELTIDYGDYATLTGYALKIFNSIGQEIHSANINQQQEVLPLGTWGGAGNYQVVIYNAQGVPVDTRTIVLQE
jgi:hypothetical protein